MSAWIDAHFGAALVIALACGVMLAHLLFELAWVLSATWDLRRPRVVVKVKPLNVRTRERRWMWIRAERSR